MPQRPHPFRALRDKYEQMLVLRAAHAREDAAVSEPDPRFAMARLAERFPGSLREIDTLPIDVIRLRIDLLTQAEGNAAATEPWMTAQVHFHRVARGALIAKRWLAGRKQITAELAAEFEAALASLDADARLVATDLATIAAPPRGRLVAFVYAKVGAMLGVEASHVRALVFLPSTRSAF